MANERGKAIDNTHLSIDQAEARGFLHRDYIAHCLRWTHVAKYCQKNYRNIRLLDIGCGVDLPLARLLYSSRLIVEDYVGAEYNHSKKFKTEPFHTGKFPLSAYGSVDFANPNQVIIANPPEGSKLTDARVVWYGGDEEQAYHRLPNTFVSFEMIEHVEPGHARATMRKVYEMMRACMDDLGENPIAFISTPCYDAQTGAAANHVNEMTYEALGAMFEDLGFVIENVAGTFASQKDYKSKLFADGHGKAFEALSKHYDSNYLATIFAPMYPELSRNAIWTLRVPKPNKLYEIKFPRLADVPGPWSSSEHWADMASDTAYVG